MGDPWTIYGPGSLQPEPSPSTMLRQAMQNLAACIQAAAIEEMRLQMAASRMTKKPDKPSEVRLAIDAMFDHLQMNTRLIALNKSGKCDLIGYWMRRHVRNK